MKKIFFIYSLPFLLAGCAGLKGNVPLQEPKDGDRARIRVIVPTVFNNYRGTAGYPNSQCLGKKIVGSGHVASSYPFGFEKNLNGQKIGVPTTPAAEKKGVVNAEAYLAANQPIIFTYLMPDSASSTTVNGLTSTRYYKGCTARVGFTPEVNADYELDFSSDNCQFELHRLMVDKDVVSATPVSTNEVKNCSR